MRNPAEPISLSICNHKNKSTKISARNSETHLPSCHNLREHIENEMNNTSMQEDRSDESVGRDQGSGSGIRCTVLKYLKAWSGSFPWNPPKAHICSMEQVIVGGFAVSLAPGSRLSIWHVRVDD